MEYQLKTNLSNKQTKNSNCQRDKIFISIGNFDLLPSCYKVKFNDWCLFPIILRNYVLFCSINSCYHITWMYIWLHLLELYVNTQGELLIISHDTVTLNCSIYMYWLISAFKTVDILQSWSWNCHWVKFNLLFSKSIKNTMKSVTLGFTSFY